jgi:hypothetical protein
VQGGARLCKVVQGCASQTDASRTSCFKQYHLIAIRLKTSIIKLITKKRTTAFNLGCGPSVTKQPSLVVLKKIGTTDVSVTPTKTTIFGAATMVNNTGCFLTSFFVVD